MRWFVPDKAAIELPILFIDELRSFSKEEFFFLLYTRIYQQSFLISLNLVLRISAKINKLSLILLRIFSFSTLEVI